jgi:hypothetical protein
MKKTLTTREVANELLYDKNAGWSRFGALALAEYLEDYEQETGEEMELDVIAIRCDYSEYVGLIGFAIDCLCPEEDFSWTSDTSDEQKKDDVRDYILDRGTLIEFDGGIIVSNF